ncbi:MAG TPA: PHP domain-containing protein [Candidatus Eisenbacteria bacterium]|nr:PHP domain-containing protein [Candidatus Eisenbacteria bacterium]
MPAPPAARGGRRIDLHAHTLISDGSLTPEGLVSLAVERGLAALAITDHDAIDAIEPARLAAPPALELVPGIEMSTALDGQDLHILGFFVDAAYPPLLDTLVRFREERRTRARAIVERLAQLGFALDPEQVLASAGPGVVGRPHVAEALRRAGHVPSVDDAFRLHLGVHGDAYVPRPAFAPSDAIALIHAAGGVSVLAHPGAMMEDAVVERLIGVGLRGIEVWHPQHGSTAVRRWHAFAERHGLLETGGSDFHHPQRGAMLGDLPVPMRALDRLKEAAGVPG